jgi:hypothetical protein
LLLAVPNCALGAAKMLTFVQNGRQHPRLHASSPTLLSFVGGAVAGAAGAIPVLLHNAIKPSSRRADGVEEPGLDDLAFASVGELAWQLLMRRRPCRPGTGRHALTLAVGGSAGHSSAWRSTLTRDRPARTGTGSFACLARTPTPCETRRSRAEGCRPRGTVNGPRYPFDCK